jgi:ferredoxin
MRCPAGRGVGFSPDIEGMPQLKIDGFGSFEVGEGQRLVNAIEAAGVDIGHRCGGKARCTTCRIKISSGEPDVMTRAEYEKLKERELLGSVRLSCQIVVAGPMELRPLMRVSEMGWSDPGPPPAVVVEPAAEWLPKDELMR